MLYVLDSNILIAYLNGEGRVVKQLSDWREQAVSFCISVITYIEVLSLPKLTAAEINKIQKFLREFTLVPLDHQLARLTAELRCQHNFGLGDSVIIATARLMNSTLVTQDKDILKKSPHLIPVQSIKSPHAHS